MYNLNIQESYKLNLERGQFMNIYLKEPDITDADRIEDYNKRWTEINESFVPFVTKETLPKYLSGCTKRKKGETCNYNCINYWIMEGDSIIGTSSIRLNIENDYDMSKYGGHIGYGVIRNKQGQGVGSLACHLLIKKCQEHGLKEVFVSCDERNKASQKVIENNSGKLRYLTVINNPNSGLHTEFNRIYDINIEESLKNFGKVIKPKDSERLNKLCKIDRTNVNDFILIGVQHHLGDALNKIIKATPNIKTFDDIKILYKYIMDNFKPDKEKKYKRFERMAEEIAESKVLTGCIDAATLIAPILKAKGIPTLIVQSAKMDWVKKLQTKSEDYECIEGHAFLEIFLNGKWHLFDSMNGYIYTDYDYDNLSLPNGYYAFCKSPSIFSSGVYGKYTSELNSKRMREIFETFDISKYKEPSYKILNLHEN